MSLLNEWIMENLGIDMKTWEQKLTKSQKREKSTFKEPNGMLGNIPVYIIEFQYSNNNNISNNKMIYNKNQTYIIDYKFPISEKRAMEQSEILNRINNEPVIRRPFYNDKSLTKINKLF